MRIIKWGVLVAACISATAVSGGAAAQPDTDSAYSPVLAALNNRLQTLGVTRFAIEKAELIVSQAGVGKQSTTIFANDRTHLFDSQFVERDPRRGGSNDISYLVDQSDGSVFGFDPSNVLVVVPNAVTEPAIDASMAVWAGMRCNGPGVVKLQDSGADPDLIDGLVLGNPALIGTPFADITHAGWLPASFFDVLEPNGSASILGITFSFVFIDGDGNPTDIDHDKRPDAAFREIYYNRSFPWGTDLNPNNVDIQSIVIHESGHGFGLAHFGKVSLGGNGKLHFSPRAIMNAVYISPDREIRGTDNASFCQAWARAK